jgi:hypothetical protein
MTDFKVGDRVKATLGENVLVGIVRSVREDEVLVEADGDKQGIWLYHNVWRIEKASPPLPTKYGAVIGHKTEANWKPYVLVDGKWYCAGDQSPAPEKTVRYFIEDLGFEVIFEGVDQ